MIYITLRTTIKINTIYITLLIIYTTKDLEEVDNLILKVTIIGLEEETVEEVTNDPKEIVINYIRYRNLLYLFVFPYLFIENPSILFISKKATS